MAIYRHTKTYATGLLGTRHSSLVRKALTPAFPRRLPRSPPHNRRDFTPAKVTPTRLRKMRITIQSHFTEATTDMTRGGRRLATVCYVLSHRYSHHYKPHRISKFCERMASRLKRRNIHYAYEWVTECVGDRIHHHVLFHVPYRTQMPAATLKPPRGHVPWQHGWASHERAHTPQAMVKYISKNATKERLPRRCRIFGVGGSDTRWRRTAYWHALPAWLREKTCNTDLLRVAKGGGYYNVSSGEVFRSPWKFELIRAGPGRYVETYTRVEAVAA